MADPAEAALVAIREHIDAQQRELRRVETLLATVITNLKLGAPVDGVLAWYGGEITKHRATLTPEHHND